ncbi:MAG: DNA gyrase inhibitor YacG [Bacteriovoracaceae bacterium]|nr:DNA gyrase inhibitor YacG [Bacteriovoracaceae bacterium]
MTTVLKVKCPYCKKQFEYKSSKYRPFCSERCKMVDLGHWLEESYQIPLEKSEESEDQEKQIETDMTDEENI